MIPSPILKALSSIQTSGAKTLLMGGQACVFYGAAEFSRDLDILLLIDPNNLARFESALGDLQAENIAVPPFDVAHLLRGHAIHFRCHRPDVADVRVDVMSTLRGVVGFEELWGRRTAIEVESEVIDMLALEDLVDAKKTQRDKDWPMIRRLVEQSYFRSESGADPRKIEFWLRELRTPELLITVAAAHPDLAKKIGASRAAAQGALREEVSEVERLLEEEEREERRRDREYWAPLKKELEQLRRSGKR